MKRLVCLLLFVSIAYAGCADKEPSKVTVVHLPPKWVSQGDSESNAVLRLKNARLEMELDRVKKVSRAILAKWEGEQSKVEIMHKQNKTLLVKIDELESQMTVESVDKTLLVKISKLEAVIESQKVAIESSKNVHRLYEAATEYQRVALDSLLNLCRLYEAEIESQREAIKVFL